ncbi:MAG TPA: prolipoprotein diacylglyceryl transferase [Kofleriaceae bacterium]|nr:prolipoprotein diacylglyceryl transferase [Kofleriaceae bacterium]
MRPELFAGFPSYLTLVLVGFLVATLLAKRAAVRAGLPGERMVDLAVLMLVLGVLGARLLSVASDGKLTDFVHLCTDPRAVEAPDAEVSYCQRDEQCGFDYRCDPAAQGAVAAGARTTMCYPPRDCLAALKFWQGGLTFYGALVFALPGALWYCRRKRLDFLQVGDLVAPCLLVGQAIGRVGCFLEGCCYGAVTGGPLGVRFPGHALARHPTQLYESAADLALAALLWFVLSPRARGRGELLGWMLALYGAVRALIELWRDDPRGGVGPLSTSQLLAIPAIALGVWLVARARRGTGDHPDGPLRSSE